MRAAQTMPTMQIHHSVSGAQQLRRSVKALAMPRLERRRLLVKIGRSVRTATRARLRGQTDLNGSPWTPRKKRESKKMLRGVGKTLRIRPNEYTVDIGPTNPVASRIAAKQQYGVDETMTAPRMAKIHSKGADKPATRAQAKALIAAGLTVKTPGSAHGKGQRRPTIRWVTLNMTREDAGKRLKTLNGKKGKRRWELPLEPRPFLGANQQDINKISDIIFASTRA